LAQVCRIERLDCKIMTADRRTHEGSVTKL
jgi:hypothetical protein